MTHIEINKHKAKSLVDPRSHGMLLGELSVDSNTNNASALPLAVHGRHATTKSLC